MIDAIGMNRIDSDESVMTCGRGPSGGAPGAAGLHELGGAELEDVEGGLLPYAAAVGGAFVAGAAAATTIIVVGFAAGYAAGQAMK